MSMFWIYWEMLWSWVYYCLSRGVVLIYKWRKVVYGPIFLDKFTHCSYWFIIGDLPCTLSCKLQPVKKKDSGCFLQLTYHKCVHISFMKYCVMQIHDNFHSAFNTVITSKLFSKLGNLGINNSIYNCTVPTDPSMLRQATAALRPLHSKQGCVLGPFIYTLFTHDCKPMYRSQSIIKFADYTTAIGLISDNDESVYREEVTHQTA